MNEELTQAPYDTVGALIDYESGEMPDDRVIELFQHLVDTRLAWQLQGSYGRTAAWLIRTGRIHPKGGTS